MRYSLRINIRPSLVREFVWTYVICVDKCDASLHNREVKKAHSLFKVHSIKWKDLHKMEASINVDAVYSQAVYWIVFHGPRSLLECGPFQYQTFSSVNTRHAIYPDLLFGYRQPFLLFSVDRYPVFVWLFTAIQLFQLQKHSVEVSKSHHRLTIYLNSGFSPSDNLTAIAML